MAPTRMVRADRSNISLSFCCFMVHCGINDTVDVLSATCCPRPNVGAGGGVGAGVGSGARAGAGADAGANTSTSSWHKPLRNTGNHKWHWPLHAFASGG